MSKTHNDELPVIKEEAVGIEKEITKITVTNDDELRELSDKVKQVKTLLKRAEEAKEKFTAPAKDIIAQAKTLYDPLIAQCKNFEKILKEKGIEYVVEKNKKIAAKQEKIVARAESGNIKEETAIKKLEELPDQSKSAKTESSEFRVSTYKDVEIFDRESIPDIYWMIDEAKVKKVVLAGVEIPGARIITKNKASSI